MAQIDFTKIYENIDAGNFKYAGNLIAEHFSSGKLSSSDKLVLGFELERMDRIRKDFTRSVADVKKYLVKYYPDIDTEKIMNWMKDGSLEGKIIDGDTLFFKSAQYNLFRINKEAKKVKEEKDGKGIDKLDLFLQDYLPKVVRESESSSTKYVTPQKFRIKYTITVDADAVPDGEIIRCWLPFPREGNSSQTEIKVLSVSEDEYVIAGNQNQQRTIYMEKKAAEGKPAIFEYEFTFTGLNQFTGIIPDKIKPYNTQSEEYTIYTMERLPHIGFTEKIKEISAKIIGDEKNPYLKAKKIFTWIDENIPWASALEYSTIRNISDYCITNMHGDCGIKTLLFITLCRYNGIPAKWQSGWMLHPPELNLHDWGAVYFEGYGWLPVDQSFGRVNSSDEKVKYFYLGSLDAYRFIVNDDYSAPLFPAKVFPRSETVDFQRGEVEWRGGNLYFDKWDYHLEIEYAD